MNRLIVSILSLMIIIIGCTNSTTETLTQKDIRKGFNALEMQFLDGAPSSIVYEGEPFAISIQLVNLGASDVTNGYLILNTESDYLNVPESIGSTPVEIEGRSLNNPMGGFEVYSYDAEALDISLSEVQESLITGTVCYDYTSIAEPEVCIEAKEGPFQITPKSCIASDIALSNGQGGPLAITKIGVTNNYLSGSLMKTRFTLSLENKKMGTVIKEGTARSVCSPEALGDRNLFNIIQVKAFLTNEELKCQNDGIVKLENNKAEITCDFTRDETLSYKAPLRVELSYGYTETISKKLKIKNNPEISTNSPNFKIEDLFS